MYSDSYLNFHTHQTRNNIIKNEMFFLIAEISIYIRIRFENLQNHLSLLILHLSSLPEDISRNAALLLVTIFRHHFEPTNQV